MKPETWAPPATLGPAIEAIQSTGLLKVYAASNTPSHQAIIRCELTPGHDEEEVRRLVFDFFTEYVASEEKWDSIIDIYKRYVPCTGNETACQEQYVFEVGPFGEKADGHPLTDTELLAQFQVGLAFLIETISPTKKTGKANATMSTWHCYRYEHLDDLSFLKDITDEIAAEHGYETAKEWIESAGQALKNFGWEGDGAIKLMWLPPFAGVGVEDSHGAYILVVKQSNNGTAFMASKDRIPFDRLNEQNGI